PADDQRPQMGVVRHNGEVSGRTEEVAGTGADAQGGGLEMSVSNSNYARLEGDKYFTPEWVTKALLSVERLPQVWDPAAGDGGIINALPVFIQRWGSDIAPDAPGIAERDFFDCPDANGYDIVTNPPYGTQSRL